MNGHKTGAGGSAGIAGSVKLFDRILQMACLAMAVAAFLLLFTLARDAFVTGNGTAGGVEPSGPGQRLLVFGLLGTGIGLILLLRYATGKVVEHERSETRAAKRISNKRARELHASEERFQDITSSVPGVVFQFTVDTHERRSFPYVGATARDILGLDPDEVVADADAWIKIIHPADLAAFFASMMESRRTLRPWSWEGRMMRASGEYAWFRTSSIPRRLADGSVLWNGIILDIDEKKRVVEALAASRDRMRLVTDNLPALIVYVDAERRYRFVNKTCTEWYARDYQDILGKTVEQILEPGEHEKLRPRIDAVMGGEQISFEETVTLPDGTTRVIQATYVPHREGSGEVAGYFALVEDVSELQDTEQQLRQSQKMEAVGQLTGGIAHDFNNLLAVVQGNAELLTGSSRETPELQEAILRATERGAELTQRLLAFSRQQPLRPQAIDLVALLTGMGELLARTLGETVEIEISIGADQWPAQADPGQVESAILNLAINARDAMEGSGRITIDCKNARLDAAYVADNPEAAESDYVVLSVTDTGSGMSPEVIGRVFEPFFTTKNVGEGTGLGLSMVYGFAKQSGGHVAIDSQEGRGTRVELYLPRAAAAAKKETLSHADLPTGRGETVLVIEDAEDLRGLCVAMLEKLGYEVLDVEAAAPAGRVLAHGARVDLLLSDVVLPGGQSGPEFAAEAVALRPDLKVIFMSGYSAEAAQKKGFLDDDKVLLNKPFEMRELASAIRQALD